MVLHDFLKPRISLLKSLIGVDVTSISCCELFNLYLQFILYEKFHIYLIFLLLIGLSRVDCSSDQYPGDSILGIGAVTSVFEETYCRRRGF